MFSTQDSQQSKTTLVRIAKALRGSTALSAFVFMCAACSAPPAEVRAVSDALDSSHQRIVEADRLCIEALSRAYRVYGRMVADSLLDADLADRGNLVEIVNADGKVEWLLNPEMGKALVKDYQGYVERLEAELEGLLSQWRLALSGSEENYRRLREWLITKWYNREPFGPDEIRGIGEAIRGQAE